MPPFRVDSMIVPLTQEEIDGLRHKETAASKAAAECQEMLSELQEFAAHQQAQIQQLTQQMEVLRGHHMIPLQPKVVSTGRRCESELLQLPLLGKAQQPTVQQATMSELEAFGDLICAVTAARMASRRLRMQSRGPPTQGRGCSRHWSASPA